MLVLAVRPTADLEKTQIEVDRYMAEYNQLAGQKKNIRTLYLLFILAIALFILFVAAWIALLFSRQIISPISALLVAASEVRKGNLSFRVRAKAIDELATLVRAFNEMMQELEANSHELENRRRFTEAILESIPTGVISVSAGRPDSAREPRPARPAARKSRWTAPCISTICFARGHGRDSISDEARAPHRRGGQPDRNAARRLRFCIWP